jgi:hypothetical protein
MSGSFPTFFEAGANVSKMQVDPRTVARDIPGVFDAVFPQLTPGVVAHFNREAAYVSAEAVDSGVLAASGLQAAMLAELGFALAEVRLLGRSDDWDSCLQTAVGRQRRYYDAVVPVGLTDEDKAAANALAENLVVMVGGMTTDIGQPLQLAPQIPGFQWIASGVGDLAIGAVLVEVKFGSKSFSSADYRQVVIYWLLSYLNSLESASSVWSEFVLVNPRLGRSVRVKAGSFLSLISGGRTMVEVSQSFEALVSNRGERK